MGPIALQDSPRSAYTADDAAPHEQRLRVLFAHQTFGIRTPSRRAIAGLRSLTLDFTPGLSADEAIRLENPFISSYTLVRNVRNNLKRDVFPVIQAMIARSERWSLREGDLEVLQTAFEQCVTAGRGREIQ